MQSVTSGAVYKAFSDWQRILTIDTDSFVDGVITPLGKILHIRLSGVISGNIANGTKLFTLPSNWKPVNQELLRFRTGVDTTSARVEAGCDIVRTSGDVLIYFGTNTPLNGTVNGVTGIYTDAFMVIN